MRRYRFGKEEVNLKGRIGKQRWLALCAALALTLSGCTSANAAGREPENTVPALIIGVDADSRGVSVTAVGQDGEKTALVTAPGQTLGEAFTALPTAGDKYFSLTNVTHILVGDGVDVAALLNYVLNDPDMSYMAKVWTTGFAGGLMEHLKEGGLERFQILEQSGTETITVKTALAELLSEKSTAIPTLAFGENGLDVVGKLYFEVR